jgi:hypothetical protein
MSIFISHLFSGSVDLVAISDNLGNLVFFEAMIFFCVGSFVDMSHSPKWSTIMKLLKLRNVEWNVQESSEAGRRASVYIVTGMLFFLQSIILAII